MKIKTVKIDTLLIDPANARKHGKKNIKELERSLAMFGQHRPAVVQESTNLVIIGNGMLEAMKNLGWEDCSVFFVQDDDVMAVKRALADNRISDLSEFDEEVLGSLIAEFELDDLPGWEENELDIMIRECSNPEAYEDDLPDPPKEPICGPGDLWQLGSHRLLCDDSTKVENIELLMDGVQVDLFLTDPPYNVNYEGGGKDRLKIQNDDMGDEQFRQFLTDAFVAADSVMRDGAVFYIWHSDKERYNFSGACREVGWTVRSCLIWVKNVLVLGRQDYHWKHEPCLYGEKHLQKEPCLYGWKEGAGHLWLNNRKQTTVLEYNKPNVSADHPTMKPVGIFDYQIRNNTREGDIVLDSFLGSGTAIIACEQNKRICYGLELDPAYCDVIIKRWETYTGKKAEKMN